MAGRVHPRQLAFSLPHAESLSRDNFLEGPANVAGLALIDGWPEWPNRIMLADIEIVADARRPLLTYAALVLEHIIRVAKPKTIVFSTFGVREGLFYEMLPRDERADDGLICAAQDLNRLLSRSADPGPCRSSRFGRARGSVR